MNLRPLGSEPNLTGATAIGLNPLQAILLMFPTTRTARVLQLIERHADAIPATSHIATVAGSLYGECMARLISTTVRLDQEDVRALKRARAAGHSTSDLVRKGLRVVAARYYKGRRPPTTGLFESTDTKLGDESELFRNLQD